MIWSLSETVSKRVVLYLLRRFFGSYLENFSGDQLSFNWNEGRGRMENVCLNVQALNELCEDSNLPLEFLHGSIDLILVKVPWTALLVENSNIEFRGLKLVLRPKRRAEDVSIFDSMLGSMTSSLQLAEECLHSKTENEIVLDASSSSDKAVEYMARTIETVMSKVKIKLLDSVINIEYVPENSTLGVVLEIKVKSVSYFDEAGLVNNLPSDGSNPPPAKGFSEPLSYSVKKCLLDGIDLYTYQFSKAAGMFSSHHCTTVCSDNCHLSPGSPEMPPTHCGLPIQKAEEEQLQLEPSLISRITGLQQIQFKLKQNESVAGPKIDIEFHLGFISLFLSPLQIHMLTELMHGLTEPNNFSKKGLKKYHPATTSRPMKTADFELIEQELQRQQEKPDFLSKSLKNHQGWSSHSLDDSDEEFHLMSTEDGIVPNVLPVANELDSSCSSIGSEARLAIGSGQEYTSEKLPKLKGSNVQALLQDPLSELTQFRACCSSLCVIVLHEDVVTEAVSSNKLPFNSRTPTKNILSLKKRAENYFDELLSLSVSGLNFKEFDSVREAISQLCQANHLRLMVCGLTMEGNEKLSSSQRLFNTSLAMLNLEILECLFDCSSEKDPCPKPSYMEIFSFKNKDVTDKNISEWKEPCFKMKYEQTDFMAQVQASKQPVNKLSLILAPVTIDVDISITDRIRSLLHPQAMFGKKEKQEASMCSWRGEATGMRLTQQTKIDLTSPLVVINFRFPVPDFRPLHDMERVPWWQQNLRKEILIMEFIDASVSTTLDNEQSQKQMDIQCRDFHGLFQESPNEKPISFLRVSVDPDVDPSSCDNGFDWPRLVIKKVPQSSTSVFDSELLSNKEEDFQYSLSDTLMYHLDKEPSPFQANSVIYGNKLSSNDDFPEENDGRKEEVIIMPAEKERILDFIELVVNKSQCVFNFYLPTVNLVLPDKHFFEILYNRLSNDLLLWENATLNPVRSFDPNGFKVHPPGLDLSVQILKENPTFQSFSNCATDYLNDSDSEDDNGIYSSSNEYWYKQDKNSLSLTKRSISLNIIKGSLTIHCPLRDSVLNVIPGYCGKLQLFVEDCTFFLASYYKGDPNEAYMCLLSNKSSLHHNGTVLLPTEWPTVHTFAKSKFSNLHPIIYRSESGIVTKPGVRIGCGDDSLDMLTLSVHTMKDSKQQIKTFKVALGLCGATLRHYVSQTSQTWLDQFMDYFKIAEYPINGYNPVLVVTDFHLQLGNCAVDYRPLHLPYRTVLTIENFYLSGNVTASTSTSMLRLISEELCFFISNDTKGKNVNLKKDYVCVLDAGLIHLSIRRTTTEDGLPPKVEMSATNNMIHIRTCADSCKALQKLLVYFANDGDLAPQPTNVKDAKEKKVVSQPTESESNLSSKLETVHNLMTEAMKDCALPKVPESAIDKNDVSGVKTQHSDSDFGSTDEEFCILEDDPGVGLVPRSGEPLIRLLTNEPIRILENHFTVPSGKSDLLKAPKNFPKPLLCYTLREMSLTWHMYGGHDFNVKKSEKKTVRISKPNSETSVKKNSDESRNLSINAEKGIISFCKVTQTTRQFNVNSLHYSMEHFSMEQNKPNDLLHSWITNGGENRNHDVLMELQLNKVRFRHEEYPEESEYASRYVLLIHDVEIRDRLASSEINKFLYQYASESMPRQTHSNMVMVKAVNIRPDPKQGSQECSLRVSCKPLRLNIDQDALIFLCEFFGEASDLTPTEDPKGPVVSPDSRLHAVLPDNVETTRDLISSPLSPATSPDKEVTVPTFYRSFSFSPDVFIRLDYHGKRVVMDQGALQGLLMGLAQLSCSELKLKRLVYRHGLLGHEKLLSFAYNEWVQDIKNNQLPGLLVGLGPMHSFFELFQGVKDLFCLPVQQYRKSGQIYRGFQKGGSSFGTSFIMAVLEVSNRVAGALQSGAEFAYDMVSPGLSVTYQMQRNLNPRRRSHPADIREGLTTAYNVFKEGLGDTARTIAHVASVEHEHKGVRGAVGGVLRQIPPTVVKPIILGTEATCLMLGGIKNQLVPDAHQEAKDKWRTKNN